MPWQETENGTFSRPLGESEAFLKLIGDSGHVLQRENWAVNTTATIIPRGTVTKADIADRLRHAWIHLRFQQPSIAAVVSSDITRVVYIAPPSNESLKKWVRETFMVMSDSRSAGEVVASMTVQPTQYARLYYIPQSDELLYNTAHWRSDGVGTFLLLDLLLQLAFAPDLGDPFHLPWGEEGGRLAPTVEDAIAINLTTPATLTAAQKALVERNACSFELTQGAVGIPYNGDSTTLPTGTSSARTTLSSDTTEKIVQACKKRGGSVTSAVHASIASVNYAMRLQHHRGREYASSVRFNLRPYLPEVFNTSTYASGLYSTAWMFQMPPDADWDTYCRTCQQRYRAGITATYLASHREFARTVADMMRTPPRSQGEPPSDVDISSIGVVDKWVRPVHGDAECGCEVRAVSIGVEMLTRQGACFVWTFRGQLNLSIVYNESFHSMGQMEEFAEKVKGVLLRELDIQDS